MTFMVAAREDDMPKYRAQLLIVNFCASAALALPTFYCCAAFAAGQPTAISNLPVVAPIRHKVKQKKDGSGAKADGKQSPSKAEAGNGEK
jgi:hypothetical protein